MRVLVLGGGWFVGRAVLEAALTRRWDVVTFTRGRSALPDGAVHVRGDREDLAALRRLAGHGPWDALIDTSGAVPAVVTASVRALGDQTDRYVFVSTVSAYRQWPHALVDESSPLWPGDPDADPGTRVWDPEAYGPLKVGCERAVTRGVDPERALVLRPHVVLGPREYVGRLAWWLRRTQQGGRILVPGPDRCIQPIDNRDLAGFLCDQVEAGAHGFVNVAAPQGRDTYGDLVRACVAATSAPPTASAPSPADLEWVDETWLVERGVRQWTEIPLWRRATAPWGMDTTRATAVGLHCRPLGQTVADTWAWLQSGGRAVAHGRHDEHGLAPTREAALLAAWAGRQRAASG